MSKRSLENDFLDVQTIKKNDFLDVQTIKKNDFLDVKMIFSMLRNH